MRAGPTAEIDPRQKIIQALASIAFITTIALPALDHRLGWSHLPDFVPILGDLLVALGFAIVFLAFRENSFTSATIEVASEQRVIDTGPYAWVRHPMYAGALVLLAGIPLSLGSAWGLLALAPMVLVLVVRLVNEERFLEKELAGYDAYRRKTRYRLVPFVWLIR